MNEHKIVVTSRLLPDKPVIGTHMAFWTLVCVDVDCVDVDQWSRHSSGAVSAFGAKRAVKKGLRVAKRKAKRIRKHGDLYEQVIL